jgi:hypothetical protein
VLSPLSAGSAKQAVACADLAAEPCLVNLYLARERRGVIIE